MTRLARLLRRFRKGEDGNGTIEFVIMLPFFLILFGSTFELGMAMTRQVMLDRGLDMTVREIRIGAITPVNHDTIKTAICDHAAIIPDCMDQVKLEMRPINPRNWSNIPNRADCIDREDDGIPVREFVPGVMNQLMILRVCALFDPYMPTSGLGAVIPRESGDAYALVAITSFVIEPS
jgi:Flp pilus assembly protein TadG